MIFFSPSYCSCVTRLFILIVRSSEGSKQRKMLHHTHHTEVTACVLYFVLLIIWFLLFFSVFGVTCLSSDVDSSTQQTGNTSFFFFFLCWSWGISPHYVMDWNKPVKLIDLKSVLGKKIQATRGQLKNKQHTFLFCFLGLEIKCNIKLVLKLLQQPRTSLLKWKDVLSSLDFAFFLRQLLLSCFSKFQNVLRIFLHNTYWD